MNKTIKPLYIWAGGKNKMIPKYLNSPGIPRTGYDTYVEPFFGGGAFMLWVYANVPTVKRFVLNDINPEITGIYTAIKQDVTQFKARMDQLEAQWLPLDKPARKQFYYELRDEYTQTWSQWNRTEESATLYFLMKTAFNGIWQTTKTSNGRFATPVGLCNQTTHVYDSWNVDLWHAFLQRVDIHTGDWSACVNTGTPTFYFMDPPYRDSFTSYGQTFTDQDHQSLIQFCAAEDAQGNTVFYCGRDEGDGFYAANRQQLEPENYAIKYTAGRRATESNGDRTAKSATEILLYSPRITSTDPLVESHPHMFEVTE